MAGPLAPPVGTRFSTGQDLGLLSGPTAAPPGAVTVTPGTDLNTVTVNNPAGTTFYLLAGTHTVGGASPGEFSQIIPKTGNTYIGAPGAVFSGRDVCRFAFTGQATDVTIKYLEVIDFTCGLNEFVINHDTAARWTIQFCNVHDNMGAGVGVGTDTVIDHCWLHHNQQYGFSSYSPPLVSKANSVTNMTIHHCEISHNGTRSLEYNPDGTPTWAGLSGAGKCWDTNGITITDNWIHHSVHVAVWADTNNVHTHIENNLFEDNDAEAIFYELSYNILIRNNTFRRNAIFKGKNWAGRSDNFPISAVYLSEAGGDAAVTPATYDLSSIEGNTFVDNWGDVTLWENADRFFPAGDTYHAYWPRGHGANPVDCNNPATKVLTCSVTAGSSIVNITSGTIAYTDEGRPVSGAGIPAGAHIRIPSFPGDQVGFNSATQFRMTTDATATATGVTVTIAAGRIDVEPWYYAARWHTQNIRVQNNTFSHDPAVVLAGYVPPAGVRTGKVAVLSQYGTFPAWSPYQGEAIQDAITFDQNNLWLDNTYAGPYSFMPHDTGKNLTFAQWQAAPYGQDASSTFTSTPGGEPPPDDETVLWAASGGSRVEVVGIHAATSGGRVVATGRSST